MNARLDAARGAAPARGWIPALLVLLPLLMLSCYYDKEELLYPAVRSGCDTTGVTFTKNIYPVLSDYCFGCHSNANAAAFGNNIRLESYGDVTTALPRVMGALAHQPGYSAMPRDGAPLNDCVLRQFALWKNNGTPL